MHLPLQMHDYPWARLLKDNPEWASLCATVLFAIITTAIIWRQVCVMQAQTRIMKWQARNSVKHERQQNRLLTSQNKLIRYQFEYSWLKELNDERKQLLVLGRLLEDQIKLVAQGDRNVVLTRWAEMRETVEQLDGRLKTLNVAVYTGQYDSWYEKLFLYVDAVLKIVREQKGLPPPASTNVELLRANERCEIDHVFTELEQAIESEFIKFKLTWDAETK